MRLSSYFMRINTQFDTEIVSIDVFERRNAIRVTVKFDSDIDLKTQTLLCSHGCSDQ